MCELNANDGHSVRRHRQVLAIACGVWVLAFALQVLPPGRVSLRGLPMIPLPQVCFSRTWLGLKCPGCGLTRSIIQLAQGNWQASCANIGWRTHSAIDHAPDPLPDRGPAPAGPAAVHIPLAGCSWLCSNRSSSGELARRSGGRPRYR